MLFNLFYKFAPCWAINLFFTFSLSKLDKRRISEIDKWLASADYVTRVTRHSEARVITSFLRDTMFHVTPTTNGFKAIRATRQMKLPITVLMSEDLHLGGIWKTQLDGTDGSFANFVRSRDGKFSVLSLKGFLNTSDLAKGILCLHEGKHAWHHLKNPTQYDVGQPEEELSVIEFECRLVELYFGQEYSKFLDSEADRIATLNADNKGDLQEIWFEQAFERFCKKIHSPVDATEKRLLSSNVQYALMFRYLDKYNRLHASSEKLRFLVMLSKAVKKYHSK